MCAKLKDWKNGWMGLELDLFCGSPPQQRAPSSRSDGGDNPV